MKMNLSWVLDYVFVEFDEEAFISEAKKQINERVGKLSVDGYFNLIDYPEFSDIYDFDDFRELTREFKYAE